MKNLVKDASMGPLREALRQGIEITKLKKEDMRPVTLEVIFHADKQELFKILLLNTKSLLLYRILRKRCRRSGLLFL